MEATSRWPAECLARSRSHSIVRFDLAPIRALIGALVRMFGVRWLAILRRRHVLGRLGGTRIMRHRRISALPVILTWAVTLPLALTLALTLALNGPGRNRRTKCERCGGRD